MNYIESLRQHIGHAPVLIVDDQNRLLSMKRLDSSSWGQPSGAVEPGEVVEEAARRSNRS